MNKKGGTHNYKGEEDREFFFHKLLKGEKGPIESSIAFYKSKTICKPDIDCGTVYLSDRKVEEISNKSGLLSYISVTK